MTKSASQAEAKAPVPSDISALSFEEAMAELEKIVRQMEDGKAKLEDALTAYERGILLKRHCEGKLREAQAKIEQISLQADGSVVTSPFSS